MRRAGSLEQERLRAALAVLETGTVLGGYKIDPVSGEQVAAKPPVVQIQLGRPEVVWPTDRATARWELPYPPWDERKLIK